MGSWGPDLPPRLTTTEVCALARISKRTFSRRRSRPNPTGIYAIPPCDHGAEDLYERDAVLRALNLVQHAPHETPAPSWENPDPDAIRRARSRQVRQSVPGPSRRDAPGRHGGAQAPSAPRLALVPSAAD